MGAFIMSILASVTAKIINNRLSWFVMRRDEMHVSELHVKYECRWIWEGRWTKVRWMDFVNHSTFETLIMNII